MFLGHIDQWEYIILTKDHLWCEDLSFKIITSSKMTSSGTIFGVKTLSFLIFEFEGKAVK